MSHRREDSCSDGRHDGGEGGGRGRVTQEQTVGGESKVGGL